LYVDCDHATFIYMRIFKTTGMSCLLIISTF